MIEDLGIGHDLTAVASTATVFTSRTATSLRRAEYSRRSDLHFVQRSRRRTRDRTARTAPRRNTTPRRKNPAPRPTRTLSNHRQLSAVWRSTRVPTKVHRAPARVRTTLLSALWKELRRVLRERATYQAPAASIEGCVRNQLPSSTKPDPCYIDSELDGNCLGCWTGNWEDSHHIRNCEYRNEHTQNCERTNLAHEWFVCVCE